MSPVAVGYVGIAAVFILMFLLRLNVGIAFGLVGFLGMWYINGSTAALSVVGTIPHAPMSMYAWTVVPLFILMGFFAEQSNLAQEFYEGVRKWVGHFRGGLAHAVILGNTGYGAVSGDSISGAIIFTTMSLPEMRKYKYADTLTLGSVAAGSFLAQLIPPSFTFIVYGALTTTSIGKLFIAGILPGLVLALLYLATVYLLCRVNPSIGPRGPKTTWREKLGATGGMWAIVILFLVIIGGLYLGVFTPTEGGAVGAFAVLVIGLARRKFSWKGFQNAILDTAVTTGVVVLLLVGALIFNVFLVKTGVLVAIATSIGGITHSAVGTLCLVIAIYFVLGMFVDGLAMMLLTVPIFYPLIMSLGVDPVHFGVIVTMMLGIGGLTLPFGVTVFAIKGAAPDVPIYTVFRGSLPFVAAMLVCVALVVFIPAISLYLPATMMR